MDNKLTLTPADLTAVELNDSNYINNKGAKFYAPESYEFSVEYYRLAAAMGNVHAISNLGYCYLYGRSIEANTSLAMAYFKIAAAKGDVDAVYKLGDIHSSDKWGLKDKELSTYYYRMAVSFVITKDGELLELAWLNELQAYPSLCFAMGREMALGGDMNTDIESAYKFLKHAQLGYEKELANGSEMYREAYEGVMKLISDPQFDGIRLRMEKLFDEDDE